MTTASKTNLLILVFATCVALSLPIFGAHAQTDYELLAPAPGFLNEEGSETTTASSYIPGAVRLVIALAGVLAILMIIFGGIKYMSTDAIGGKSSAKDTIENAIWGFVLIISAWLILNTINPNLVKFNFSISRLDTGTEISGNLGQVGSPAPDTPREACIDCATLPRNVFVIKPAGTGTPVYHSCRRPSGIDCFANKDLVEALVDLNDLLQLPNVGLGKLRITEAFPPTVIHENSCHREGTCVDAGFFRGLAVATPENIERFISLARQVRSGTRIRAVYEVRTEERREEILEEASSLTTSDVDVVEWISAEHFSIYKN